MTTPPGRHLSMLRSYTWADALTVGNDACGTVAILLCLDLLAEQDPRYLWTAFLLLPLALVLDVLDGYGARLGRWRQSVLGRARSTFDAVRTCCAATIRSARPAIVVDAAHVYLKKYQICCQRLSRAVKVVKCT